jgi:hypothetical protein
MVMVFAKNKIIVCWTACEAGGMGWLNLRWLIGLSALGWKIDNQYLNCVARR